MGGRLFFVGEVNALDNIKAAAIQLGCVEMEEDVFVNRFDACVNCIVMAVLGVYHNTMIGVSKKRHRLCSIRCMRVLPTSRGITRPTEHPDQTCHANICPWKDLRVDEFANRATTRHNEIILVSQLMNVIQVLGREVSIA